MKINKTTLLSTVLISSNVFANSLEKKEKQPNIIFILADDQRALGTIHALGGSEVITPNIDALVKAGTSFTNSYIMGGSQPAVSAPSRNMIMTGRNLFSIGTENGSNITDNQTTMGECFGKAGYETYGVGKWHNNPSAFNRTFQGGNDIFFGGMGDQFKVPLNHYDPTGRYNNSMPIPGNVSKKAKADHFFDGKHSSEIFKDAALKFIKEYADKKPFFLYVAFTSPHDPRNMPPKYLALYDTANISIPKNFLSNHPFDNGELTIRDEKLAAFPRNPKEIKSHIRDYYAMITHLDDQVGEIIQSLKDKGLYENTIIVFAADNGLALGQHGLMGKQNVYEHSVKVPLVIAGKNIEKGKINSNFVYLFDIFPTLCNLTGTPIPATVQGRPFMGKNVKPRTTMFYAYRNFQRAVRKGNWKLIEYYVNGVRTEQLFDLKSDPYEIQNRVNAVGAKQTLKIMRDELKKQRTLNNDNLDLVKMGMKDTKVPIDTH